MPKSDARILRLIDMIDSGSISPDAVGRKLDSYEKTYGTLDILYDVKESSDSAYYDELISNARIGIYNRASLVKMAEIQYKGDGKEDKKSFVTYIIAGVLVVAVIIGVIIAVLGGE